MKKILLFLLTMILSIFLVACGATDNTAEKTTTQENIEEQETVDNNEEKAEKQSDMTLPDGFPKDFLIPDEFTITDVEDESEGNDKHYSIDFDFDPALDMESVFNLYKAYSEEIGYNVLIGGEEFFAEDIFQYGAHDPKSASNMFIITMSTKKNVYGNIDLRFVEE